MSFIMKYKHGTIKYDSAPLERAISREQLLNDDTLISIYIALKPFYDMYTPKQEGDLAAGATPTAEGLKYMQAYAHYQYYGILMVDPETGSSYAQKDAKKIYTSTPLNYQSAAATAFWDMTAWERHGDEMQAAVQEILARRAREILRGEA